MNDEISELNEKVNSGEYSEQLYNSLIEKNEELIEFRKNIMNGAVIRSRANWLEYGEKTSKSFLNLETKNTINKSIPELMINNNKITDQEQIIKEVRNYIRRRKFKIQLTMTHNVTQHK